MYQKFGRTEAQIEMIRQAVPKRHYLYQNGNNAALIDLRLGKHALAFVGVDVNKSGARIDELFREHGDSWTTHWLQERLRT
jgi:type IV secretion system protein TrbE